MVFQIGHQIGPEGSDIREATAVHQFIRIHLILFVPGLDFLQFFFDIPFDVLETLDEFFIC